MEVKYKYEFLDILINLYIFTPLVCLFWHGMFGVLDMVLLLEHPVAGPWVLILFGTITQVFCSCLQNYLASYVSKRPPDAQKKYITMYNFLLGSIQIAQFRGLNDLYEQYIGVMASDAISATFTSIILLCSLRICTQVVDIPFTLTLDSEQTALSCFKMDTYYRTRPGFNKAHVFDSVCTMTFIQSSALLFNISAWVAVHVLFFPGKPFFAMMLSWICGYGLSLLLIYLSPKIQNLAVSAVRSDAVIIWHLFMDMVFILQGIGVVMAWHGYFELYDVLRLYFPITQYNYDFTPVYESLSAFILLVLCQTSSVLVRRGITYDTVQDSISTLKFDVKYFSNVYYIEERQRAQEDENSNVNNIHVKTKDE